MQRVWDDFRAWVGVHVLRLKSPSQEYLKHPYGSLERQWLGQGRASGGTGSMAQFKAAMEQYGQTPYVIFDLNTLLNASFSSPEFQALQREAIEAYNQGGEEAVRAYLSTKVV